jgi:hypothetical protein
VDEDHYDDIQVDESMLSNEIAPPTKKAPRKPIVEQQLNNNDDDAYDDIEVPEHLFANNNNNNNINDDDVPIPTKKAPTRDVVVQDDTYDDIDVPMPTKTPPKRDDNIKDQYTVVICGPGLFVLKVFVCLFLVLSHICAF